MEIDKLIRRLTTAEVVIQALMSKNSKERFVEHKLAAFEELLTEIPEKEAELIQEWEGRLLALWTAFGTGSNQNTSASKTDNKDTRVSSSVPTVAKPDSYIPSSFQPLDTSTIISSSSLMSSSSVPSIPLAMKQPHQPKSFTPTRIPQPQRVSQILDITSDDNRLTHQPRPQFSSSTSSFASPRSASTPRYESYGSNDNNGRFPSTRGGQGGSYGSGFKPRNPNQDPQQRAHIRETVITGIRDMFQRLPIVDRFATIDALRDFRKLVQKADQGLSQGSLHKSKHVQREVMAIVLPKLATCYRERFLVRSRAPGEVRWLLNFLNNIIDDPEAEGGLMQTKKGLKRFGQLAGVECGKCGMAGDHFESQCYIPLIDKENKEKNEEEVEKKNTVDDDFDWTANNDNFDYAACYAAMYQGDIFNDPKPSTSDNKVEDTKVGAKAPATPESTPTKEKSFIKSPRVVELDQEFKLAQTKLDSAKDLKDIQKFDEFFKELTDRWSSLQMEDFTSTEGNYLLDTHSRIMAQYDKLEKKFKDQ